MRPLMVRTVRSSGPLFCSRLPVRGCSGGGESRFRGVESELHGGLVGGLAEDAEEVSDLLLAVVDDLAGRGAVDGSGDVKAKPLELAAQLVQQGVGRQLGLGGHRGLRVGEGRVRSGRSKGRTVEGLRSGYDFPKDLPRPARWAWCSRPRPAGWRAGVRAARPRCAGRPHHPRLAWCGAPGAPQTVWVPKWG